MGLCCWEQRYCDFTAIAGVPKKSYCSLDLLSLVHAQEMLPEHINWIYALMVLPVPNCLGLSHSQVLHVVMSQPSLLCTGASHFNHRSRTPVSCCISQRKNEQLQVKADTLTFTAHFHLSFKSSLMPDGGQSKP